MNFKSDYTKETINKLFRNEVASEFLEFVKQVYFLEIVYGVEIDVSKIMEDSDGDLRVMNEKLELIEEKLKKE